MKITIRENNVATIHDQLDEQGIKKLPLNVRSIHFIFWTNVLESDRFQDAKMEGLMFSLSDWGILNDIESIETSYETLYMSGEDYKVEILLIV